MGNCTAARAFANQGCTAISATHKDCPVSDLGLLYSGSYKFETTVHQESLSLTSQVLLPPTMTTEHLDSWKCHRVCCLWVLQWYRQTIQQCSVRENVLPLTLCQCYTLSGRALQSLEKSMLSLKKTSSFDSVTIFQQIYENFFSELQVVTTKSDLCKKFWRIFDMTSLLYKCTT